MTTFTPDVTARVARLARLRLRDDELARLAPVLESIATEFSSLAERAAALPEPASETAGATREDVVEPAPRDVVDGILRAAAPRVDAATREVVAAKPEAPP